jgi:hypothetical protein
MTGSGLRVLLLQEDRGELASLPLEACNPGSGAKEFWGHRFGNSLLFSELDQEIATDHARDSPRHRADVFLSGPGTDRDIRSECPKSPEHIETGPGMPR